MNYTNFIVSNILTAVKHCFHYLKFKIISVSEADLDLRNFNM
jgi:hypothetical protein